MRIIVILIYGLRLVSLSDEKMRKRYLCLLTVAIVITSIVAGGCTTSNQANQASSSETSTNASTTISATTTATTTTATTTTAATPSPTVTPSPSASPIAATPSPTVTPSPSASPTATLSPSVSGQIDTSIQFAREPRVVKGTGQDILYVNVISSTSGSQICSLGTVTVSGAGGQTIGTVSSGGSDCFYTAYLDTSSLNPGTYDVTLTFAGDSCHQPSQSTSTITIL